MSISKAREAIDDLEKQMKDLIARTQEQIPQPKQFVKYPDISNYKTNIGHKEYALTYRIEVWFENTGNCIDTINKRLGQIKGVYDQYIKDCEEVKSQNKIIAEHNQKVWDKIKDIMLWIGVKEQYSKYGYATPRSSKMTKQIHRAGYLEDLANAAPVIVPMYKEIHYWSAYEAHAKKLIQDIEKKQIQQEREEYERTKKKDLAKLAVKYDVDDIEDICSIKESILNKNKYLRLAHYLECNRTDWSDGYSYAESGIDGFIVETEDDAKIKNCIMTILINDDYPDGRSFRDCEWNYNVLYGMVNDDELLKDYNKLKNFIFD